MNIGNNDTRDFSKCSWVKSKKSGQIVKPEGIKVLERDSVFT